MVWSAHGSHFFGISTPHFVSCFIQVGVGHHASFREAVVTVDAGGGPVMHEQAPMGGHGQPPMGHGPPPMGGPGQPLMGVPGQPPMVGQMATSGMAPGMMGIPQQAPGMFPHPAQGQLMFNPHRPPVIAKGGNQQTHMYNILPMISFKVRYTLTTT